MQPPYASPTSAPPPPAPVAVAPRRRPRPGRSAARPGLPSLLAIGSGALVVAIHNEAFPYPPQQFLRDWMLHFVATVAATIFTAAALGYRRSSTARHQRTLLRLGCVVPLAITVLHELGQWLWPAGARDTFDSVRDALLNVAGTTVAWWSLRRRSPASRLDVQA